MFTLTDSGLKTIARVSLIKAPSADTLHRIYLLQSADADMKWRAYSRFASMLGALYTCDSEDDSYGTIAELRRLRDAYDVAADATTVAYDRWITARIG